MDLTPKFLIQSYILSYCCMLMMVSGLLLNVEGWSYFNGHFQQMAKTVLKPALIIPGLLIVGKVLRVEI